MYRGSDWDYRNDPRMDEYRKDIWLKKHRDDHRDFDRFRRDHRDEDKEWKKYEKYDKYDKDDKDKHHHHHHEWKHDKHHEKDKHKWDKEKEKHHDHHKKWKAVCDMGETDEYWLVRAELPGVRKDNLCVEMEGKDLIICGKKKKEFWHDKLLKRGPKHNQNCTCGDNCTCHPTCKCGVSTVSKDEKGKTIEASLRGDVKDSERKGELKKDKGKDMKFEKHMNWWKKERGGKGKFKRRVHLPKKVDHTAIEALYKDGVLEVLIKKPMGEKRMAEGGHTIPVH